MKYPIDDFVELSEDIVIGRGRHKKCYKYPRRDDLCIKLAYNEGGAKDIEREIRYLRTLKQKNKDYSVLPEYYGAVRTNLGSGHVYERICDWDGQDCLTLMDVITNSGLLEQYYDLALRETKNLRRILLDNEIITMDLFPVNMLLQKKSDGNVIMRLINDMGSGSLLPLSYYSSWFARKHIIKHWRRFVSDLERYKRTGRLCDSNLVDGFISEMKKDSVNQCE